MEQNNRYKTMGLNKTGWDALKSEYKLDIELGEASDKHHLGNRMHVMRIDCLEDDSRTTFTAKEQAKRFFDTEWKPMRLSITREANDFRSKIALNLTVFMAKQQRELDKKERKKEGRSDSDDDDDDGEGDDESED